MKKILFTLLLLSSVLISSENNLKIMTENYPPYNMEKDGQLTGISIDLIKEIFTEIKSQQTEDDIILTSWSRAYHLAEKKKDHMVFSTTRTKARENKFKWVGPITKTSVGIIALKDIHIEKTSDLNKFRVGAVIRDVGEQLLLDQGVDKKSIYSISGKNPVSLSFKKLQNNRIDMFAYELNVANFIAKQDGLGQDEYKIIHTLTEGELYFAFNINTDDKTIQKWQKALDTIKKSGKLEKILENYR